MLWSNAYFTLPLNICQLFVPSWCWDFSSSLIAPEYYIIFLLWEYFLISSTSRSFPFLFFKVHSCSLWYVLWLLLFNFWLTDLSTSVEIFIFLWYLRIIVTVSYKLNQIFLGVDKNDALKSWECAIGSFIIPTAQRL